MEEKKKLQFLDGTMLKIIAMICMVSDHIGAVFFSDHIWFRMIGRIAMPIFSFCIAEGYIHTSNRKKYIFRLGLFALISEAPFDLAFEGKISLNHQNIMLTYFLSVIALRIFDSICGKMYEESEKQNILKIIFGTLSVVAMAIIALLLRTDYTYYAVIAVFLFYILRNTSCLVRTGAGVAFLALTRTIGFYCATGLSIIPLLLYNGEKGKGLKWLFYAFYPGHFILLYVLKTFLSPV